MSDDELLRALSAEARRLAGEVSGPLRRVRVRAGGTAVELEWDAQSEARPAAPVPSTQDAPAAPTAAQADTGPETVVSSPMVGTFYHAPSPGDAPFVTVGGIVTPDTVIGIVEAMKLMNQITADASGVVREVLVPNGGTVEFEQPILLLDPLPEQGGDR